MTQRNRAKIFIIAAGIFLTLCLESCSEQRRTIVEDTQLMMGTVVEIKACFGKDMNEAAARKAIKDAFAEFKRLENLLSVYKPDSEVSKINGLRKNERLQLPAEVFALLHDSIVFSRKTAGAFDITVKPLIDLWHKAAEKGMAPAEYEIKFALAHTGYKNILLDDAAHTISFKEDGMAIDLGGVAKGYAIDRAVTILKERRISSALVNAGGDIYCMGKRSERELWSVGIRHPRDKKKVFLKIRLEDKAIDTSGDYERFFILNGKRYSHIINPFTGYPIGDDIVSATVIASDSQTADMLATALAVLGEKGFAIVEAAGAAGEVIVTEKNGKLNVKMSDGLKKLYDISQKKI